MNIILIFVLIIILFLLLDNKTGNTPCSEINNSYLQSSDKINLYPSVSQQLKENKCFPWKVDDAYCKEIGFETGVKQKCNPSVYECSQVEQGWNNISVPDAKRVYPSVKKCNVNLCDRLDIVDKQRYGCNIDCEKEKIDLRKKYNGFSASNILSAFFDIINLSGACKYKLSEIVSDPNKMFIWNYF